MEIPSQPGKIEIFPILNQSKDSWEEFAEIESNIFPEDNNSEHKDARKALSISLYRIGYNDNMRYNKTNFAFGAFNNKKMVGFVNGYQNTKDLIISQLYVLPAFSGNNVFEGLLNNAESSANLNAVERIKIEMHGFRRPSNFEKLYSDRVNKPFALLDNKVIKNIKDYSQNGVTSVFGSTDNIYKMCCAVASPDKIFDIDYSNERTPIFVYQSNGRIRGLIGGRLVPAFKLGMINDLHIAQSYSCTGIDKELFDAFSTYAKHKGITKVIPCVNVSENIINGRLEKSL